MSLKDPSFTIGIEEEFLLVDRASRDLVREIPPQLFQDCEQVLRGQAAEVRGQEHLEERPLPRFSAPPGF